MFYIAINSSINQLTNYHNTTTKSWLVCFLELVSVACHMSKSAWVLIDATGRLVQADTLLKTTT